MRPVRQAEAAPHAQARAGSMKQPAIAAYVEKSGVFKEYNYLVRVKTSVTLPKELLKRLDQLGSNRSALLERAAHAYLAQLERQARDKRDIEIINRNATRLNREAKDALKYQRIP